MSAMYLSLCFCCGSLLFLSILILFRKFFSESTESKIKYIFPIMTLFMFQLVFVCFSELSNTLSQQEEDPCSYKWGNEFVVKGVKKAGFYEIRIVSINHFHKVRGVTLSSLKEDGTREVELESVNLEESSDRVVTYCWLHDDLVSDVIISYEGREKVFSISECNFPELK